MCGCPGLSHILPVDCCSDVGGNLMAVQACRTFYLLTVVQVWVVT